MTRKKRTLTRPITICIASQKGGVGKSSLAVNLIDYLLKYVGSLLIMDLDPQANTSWWLCEATAAVTVKIEHLLSLAVTTNFREEPARSKFFEKAAEAKVDTYSRVPGHSFTLITSSLELGKPHMQNLAIQTPTATFDVLDALRLIAQDYSITLIDTPPNLESLTFAALAASDYLLIPIQPDALAMTGAKHVIELLPKIREHFNNRIKVLGIVINEHTDTRVARSAMQDIYSTFSDGLFFKTVIKRSVKVGELPSSRSTLMAANPSSKSGGEYEALAKEIYNRILKLEMEDEK